MKREGLLRLIEDAKLAKFEVVLTEGLGRVSRNRIDSHVFYDTMEFLDIAVFTLEDNAVLDEMRVTFRSLQHSQYIKTLGLNVRRGQTGVIRGGRGVGRPPYGYKIVRTLDQVKGVWEIDETQAPVVKRIYEELAAGKSALAICADLNAQGIHHPQSKLKKWRKEQILGNARRKQGVARSPIYRGHYVWGKSKVRRAPDGTPVSRVTPEEDHVTFERPDLRIVDDALWEAVQAKLNTAATVALRHRRRASYVLSGLTVCALCNQTYRSGSYGRLRCAGYTELGNCQNNRSVLKSDVETAVLDALAGPLLKDELVADYVEEYKSAQAKEQADRQIMGSASRKREATLERERTHLVEKIANGKAVGAVGELILAEIEKRTVELDLLRQQLNAPTLPVLGHDPVEIANRFRQQIATFRENLTGTGANVVQAREAIRALIDKVEITPVGEGDGRGCGPVSIRVEGKIAALVDVAEGVSACSLLLCSSAQTQQDLTKRIWTLTTSLRNAHPGEGSHRDKPHILEALKKATSPLSTRSLVQQVQSAAGEPTKANTKQDWDRLVRALNYLRKEGVVVVSDAPRDHYRQRFWALAERQSEFWPDGVPTQEGRHLGTRGLLALLESASEPLTCRQIVIKTTDLKGLSTKRVQMLCSRMWYCLEYHRKKGVVEKVPMPQWGKKVHGWVIVRERKGEQS